MGRCGDPRLILSIRMSWVRDLVNGTAGIRTRPGARTTRTLPAGHGRLCAPITRLGTADTVTKLAFTAMENGGSRAMGPTITLGASSGSVETSMSW